MTNSVRGLLVLAMGILAMSQSDAEARTADLDKNFCSECVEAYECGMEETVCALLPGNCFTGNATCQEFGSCNGEQRLVVCNPSPE